MWTRRKGGLTLLMAASVIVLGVASGAPPYEDGDLDGIDALQGYLSRAASYFEIGPRTSPGAHYRLDVELRVQP